MKNPIPCNDYYHTPVSRRDRIDYRFVTDDGNTPSGCTVRIGDTDPATGEAVTDLTFFREYHRLADHQIYVNGKQWKNQVSIDAMVNDEGESKADRKTELSIPPEDPFGENLPDRILALREIASSLDGRLADVYEAMLVQHAGGKEKLSLREIAEKWDVHLSQVYKDREKITKMIRERLSRI